MCHSWTRQHVRKPCQHDQCLSKESWKLGSDYMWQLNTTLISRNICQQQVSLTEHRLSSSMSLNCGDKWKCVIAWPHLLHPRLPSDSLLHNGQLWSRIPANEKLPIWLVLHSTFPTESFKFKLCWLLISRIQNGSCAHCLTIFPGIHLRPWTSVKW